MKSCYTTFKQTQNRLYLYCTVATVATYVVMCVDMCYLVLPWLQELYWQGEAAGCPQQEQCSPVSKASSSLRRHQTVWSWPGKGGGHELFPVMYWQLVMWFLYVSSFLMGLLCVCVYAMTI